jgi:hypothetical protein
VFNPIVIKTFLDVATTNTWSPTVLNRIAVGFFLPIEIYQMKQTQFYLTTHTYVEVICSEPANVLLINKKHYAHFCQDSWAEYHGGFFTHFPVIIEVPYDGIWNVVVDTHTSGCSPPEVNISILSGDKTIK